METARVNQDAATLPARARDDPRPEPAGDDDALIGELRAAFGFAHDDSSKLDSPSGTGFQDVLKLAGLPPAARLGDFEILAEIGRGGMGIVYRARQVSLDRVVALKVLPSYARHGRLAVQRFRAEAQAAARVHHTNVVPIYGQGDASGHFYYAMELIDGVALDQVIHSHPDLLSSTRARSRSRASSSGHALASAPTQPVSGDSPGDGPSAAPPAADDLAPAHWTRADYRHLATLIAELAEGLAAAHEQGVVHRDVKPHNILLGAGGHLHLTDFGLARLLDTPHITVTGEVLGTPAYLSPEQVRGDVRQIDQRTDIYSLGVTLYELLTQHKPHEGATRAATMRAICDVEPAPPRRLNPDIPLDLETICLRAMSKEPGRRYATAGALADDLRRFAAGRPIVARRTTRLEKAWKWTRRHPALTIAGVATAAALALAGGLGWSITAARADEARRLLHDVYTKLAYEDYRQASRVADDLARAAALGADAHDLEVVQGLAHIGLANKDNWDQAVVELERASARAPRDLRPRYLLAWLHRERGDRAAAKAALETAEQLGPPTTPDVWFFRGLAMHFDDPSAAAESYRTANALRAADGSFYPQALLHLARARNQELYVTHSLDSFAFADAAHSLELLVDNHYYGAYPYYLLSIANRLAAEIYRDGTRPDVVQAHYAAALAWAQRGEALDPQNDRPITAEAECLESLGDLEGALDARTRALQAAQRDVYRFEALHYRWRLNYWLGHYDRALTDLEACTGYDPGNFLYAHVYPALVSAAAGDTDGARRHAAALINSSAGSALKTLWAATTLRLLFDPEEAERLLAERRENVDYGADLAPPQSESWLRALYACCQSGCDLGELQLLAQASDRPWQLMGEAYFHEAARVRALGDEGSGRDRLENAYRSFDGEDRYTYHARVLLGPPEKLDVSLTPGQL